MWRYLLFSGTYAVLPILFPRGDSVVADKEVPRILRYVAILSFPGISRITDRTWPRTLCAVTYRACIERGVACAVDESNGP
jgi:hypothetical protein